MTAAQPARLFTIPRLLLIVVLVLSVALLAQPQWLGTPTARSAVAGLITLLWLAFAGTTWLRHRRAQRALKAAMRGEAGATIVAYASQTGQAERYAEQTAEALRAAGTSVRLLPLSHLDAETLAQTPRALFIASTTGEGDAPDNASGFVRHLMASSAPLPYLAHLDYGVLALGDRSYSDYCGFGHALDRWLRHQHAQPLFDIIEVDNGDTGALRHWQHQLGVLTGQASMQDWSTPHYARWQLAGRTLLNAGSPGAPAFHIVLKPLDGTLDWQAGDIAEIGPCNAPHAVTETLLALGADGDATVTADGQTLRLADLLARCQLPAADTCTTLRAIPAQALAEQLALLPHREYSIASLPADGQLELLVRRMAYPDGTPGVGSGWLTQHAAPGSEIALRIRANRNFHTPPDDRPLILIGNGTGLAGLRAHLKARAFAGHHRNWLLFGERTAAHDQFFAEELQAWQAQGVLQRVDLAFSRDTGGHRYVQDCVRAAAADLRAWVAAGAAIYVCGSLQGMASGVDHALHDALGTATVETLADTGRYRRDVY